MDIHSLDVAFFSPTHSTKRMALNAVNGLNLVKVPTELIDISASAAREKKRVLRKDGLLLAATPTYGGRVPNVCPPVFTNFEGSGTPAILLVTYGVKGYGSTLHELNAILSERGFICIAAAAFVTEHTFSQVVGAGRPNAQDYQQAVLFGEQTREKLDRGDFSTPVLPGGEPYPYHPVFPYDGPVTDDTCTMCNACYRWCPADAIPSHAPNQTDFDKCIRCLSCIEHCPIGSREMLDPIFHEKVSAFEKLYANEPGELELFL